MPVVPVVPVVCGVGGSAVCNPARTSSRRDVLERLIKLVGRRKVQKIYSKQPTPQVLVGVELAGVIL